MKTDDLIAAMAADRQRPAPRMAQAIATSLCLGGLISLGLYLAVIGLRPDLQDAILTWRFSLKLLIVGVALILALVDCIRASNPLATGLPSRWSLLLPILIASAVGLELASTPPESWNSRLIGANRNLCLVAIPFLSLPPLVMGLLAMRAGAAASPTAAGAAVGRLAAATATMMYALHCIDDSPLFVASWYALAAVPVIAIGALAGRNMLRW